MQRIRYYRRMGLAGTLACLGWLFVGTPSYGANCNVEIDDVFDINGAQYCHVGGGRFEHTGESGSEKSESSTRTIDLRKIEHAHDQVRDPDVPIYTDVLLPGITPELVDHTGRKYALITLYNIDPPLEDLASEEAGIDRGLDYRDASNLVRSAYSNYVSPVFTNDRERKSLPGHPIGHFYVKVEIPGYPPILTGMTTIIRADEELVDLTLKKQLGIGGVLLTPQPGRLNSAAEAMEELNLRQRELLVVDGLKYRLQGGRNIGPTYVIDDGNVVFARFRVPRRNAKDALAVFLGFIDRGIHNTFGSLLSRPSEGTGAGCSAFAMLWLKASGIIPFIDEATIPSDWERDPHHDKLGQEPWMNFYNHIRIPWAHIGCDNRVGLTGVRAQSAEYTVYDNLFYRVPAELIALAREGLAEKIRRSSGEIVGTLFRFGALTPLRDLVIASKRKDPLDQGDYNWSTRKDAGLVVGFWDNSSFSDWVKSRWALDSQGQDLTDEKPIRLVKEGRFYGIEVDASSVPKASADYFEQPTSLDAREAAQSIKGRPMNSCRSVFARSALQ